MPLALQRLHRRRPGLIATLKGTHTEVVQWTEGNVYSLLQHEFVQIFRLKILKLHSATRKPDSLGLSVLGVWQTFLWRRHRTRHFEDKRLRSMTVSPWCGCQATLVWQPLLPFSCKLSWFCCERFLYMNLWEWGGNCRRGGKRPPWGGHFEPLLLPCYTHGILGLLSSTLWHSAMGGTFC